MIREGWLDLRNRVLSSPSFQRWAARFPLTRGVSRRRARAAFDLCAGFVYSQVLRACIELEVLDRLAAAPLDCHELADASGLTDAAMSRLLVAAASLDLVEPRPDGRFVLGVHGASIVYNDAVRAMVAHHALLYRDLSDPVALLAGRSRDTELRRFWAYGRNDGAEYSVLMTRSVGLIAEDIVEAYPFARHRHLLDVGGGEGAFAELVAAHTPSLDVTLFDLPPVANRARARLGDRVSVVGGDALADPLPTGADVATLVRVLHDHDDEDALALLRAIRRVLPANGTLVVAEPMADTSDPSASAYFGFYLLAMGQGRPRTEDEITRLLRAAGFGRTSSRPTRRAIFSRILTGHVSS